MLNDTNRDQEQTQTMIPTPNNKEQDSELPEITFNKISHTNVIVKRKYAQSPSQKPFKTNTKHGGHVLSSHNSVDEILTGDAHATNYTFFSQNPRSGVASPAYKGSNIMAKSKHHL